MDKNEDLEIIEDVNPINNEDLTSTLESANVANESVMNSEVQPIINNVESVESGEPQIEQAVNMNSGISEVNTEVQPIENNVESAVSSNEEIKVQAVNDTNVTPVVAPEVLDIDEGNKKPEIVKEQVMTEKQKEEKQSKSGMTLVIVILLILILFVLFLPQITEMLSK